nr:retrovirus-related Pol polyprotein from transposon TNT 1-94 [Tanacetum cinerariifolium]GEZ79554.1 retrovirus-related Pol polyprotein from transposon TNT 1-94 [Tanacetum cinerariifolium]
MLIFSRAPLFLWAEAIATVCFTQNRSIIHCRFNKTPYELINGRKPDISVGNKMHKAFPLPVIKFPLAEEVPTNSEESSHCQKKRDATAMRIALL